MTPQQQGPDAAATAPAREGKLSKKKTTRRRPRRQEAPRLGVVPVGLDAVARHFRARLASKEWWGLVSVLGSGGAFVQEIEAAFYPDEANDDFEATLLFLPWPTCVFFAHKRRLPTAEL